MEGQLTSSVHFLHVCFHFTLDKL